MKPKNVMLMGFINRAADYLNQHLDDENNSTLEELKSIDLASLKDELGDDIDSTLGVLQSTVSTLLNAGGAAFDRFIDNHSDNDTFADSVGRIFNVNLDETKPISDKEYLDKLLSFYNLDEDFMVADEDIPASTPIITNDTDDEILEKISKYANKNNVSFNNAQNNETVKKLDEVFSEIVNNENNVSDDTPEQFSSLINDLKNQIIHEDKQKKATKKAKLEEVFSRISKIYPFLDSEFIEAVYDLKAEISREYPLGLNIILLHRIKFRDVESLRQFIEITINHGYTINADENQMIVDVFKQFVNEDGKILNNIFEIANQAFLLKAGYEGYEVIINEDE